MCHQTLVDWWDLTLRFAVVLVAFLVLPLLIGRRSNRS
jgi:hypothetical protein